ncbi:hypothetical protein Godav_022978 [Gossypium davidsonii]|uniref:DUF4283 domain-containing protein n=2 Tax=Gossypium TaxID=3633 RepID=A0A7J8SQM8_GOSDV|nr:hypothetical protein [Gossypium davidsonii]MBA0663933.1 hypothetical protein [Gossypium klotzschianum]
MKSIWKTKKKFEIHAVGQNLFMITFEDEEDLKQILEGRPCCLGHGIKGYMVILSKDREKVKDDLPYSLALKAESSLLGRESLKLGFSTKRAMKQCYYTGKEVTSKDGGSSLEVTRLDHRKEKEASLE